MTVFRSTEGKTSRQLFEAQAQVLRSIAAEESCVIVGRCGFHIFADTPNALKIFIHADDECRARRIADKYGLTERDAHAMIVDNDYNRELYTKTFTGRTWQVRHLAADARRGSHDDCTFRHHGVITGRGPSISAPSRH